jgi:type I restriction enzyme S subunit
MSNYKTYPEYKDSEEPWMKDIPEHWEVKKVKFLFSISKRISGELGHNVLSITQKGIKVKDIESGGGQLSMDYSKYQLVDKGDFGMNHMDLLTGFVDISGYDGVMSPDYRVFKLKDKDCDPRYMLYIFQKGYWDKLFFPLGQGSSEIGRWRLPSDEWKLFDLPVPPKPEQTAISNFLDKKTEQIKAFIALKEKTIKLLKERKIAVINQAVTKGLDSSVEMKDSGIEWLGEVPKHWEVKKLKYLSKCRNNQRVPIEASIRGQMKKTMYDYYGATGIIDKVDDYIYDEDLILIAEDGGNLLMRNIKLVYVARGKYWVNNHAHIFKPLKFMEIEYLANTMEMYDYTTLISGSAQPKLTKSAIIGIELPQPLLEEQTQIIEFIRDQTEVFNKSITQAEKEIALIKEYQKSLISEAVTGKIDLRGEHCK